jgi:hypothetical protein
MGIWSDWYSKNAGKENSLVNAEWVLKKIDEASGNNAPINATLNDAAESDTLPATTSTPLITLLQTIRNNLKWLFNKKLNISDLPTSMTPTAHTHTVSAITDFLNSAKNAIFTETNKTLNYVKFSSGLIIQWGGETSNSNSGGIQVYFPLAFTQIPVVLKTLKTTSGSAPAAYSYISVWDVTTTGFKWNNPGCPQNWLAIGF